MIISYMRGFHRSERGWGVVWLLAALAAGLGLRLWFIAHGPRVTGDTLVYGGFAKNLLQRGVYGFTTAAGGVRPTLIRLPGYPLFLAACFRVFGVENYRAVMDVQAVVDLGTCLLVAGTAGRLFGRRAFWVGLWIGVLCPFTANYVAVPLTETLSLLCVAGAFYGMVRWREAGFGVNRWCWVIGAALAYAVLLRPEQGLLAAAVVPGMGRMVLLGTGGWRRFGPAVVASLMVVLPLVPWAARNWRVFHVFEPLAPRYATDPGEKIPLGFQRWFRTWGVDFISTDQVYWRYDTDPILVTDLPSRAFDSAEQRAATAALLDEYNVTTSQSDALDRRFAELARERVAAGWFRYYVEMPVGRMVNMLLRPRVELLTLPLDWWNWRGRKMSSFESLELAGVNLAYMVLAGMGVWRWRGDPVRWAMVALFVLRGGMLLTIDNSEPRYTLEFFPVWMVWAGAVFGGRGRMAADSLQA
jgi:hypothetical protein